MSIMFNGGNRYDQLFMKLQNSNLAKTEKAGEPAAEESAKKLEDNSKENQTKSEVRFPVENNREVVPRTIYAGGAYYNINNQQTASKQCVYGPGPQVNGETPNEPQPEPVKVDPPQCVYGPGPEVNGGKTEEPLPEPVNVDPPQCVYGPGPEVNDEVTFPDFDKKTSVITGIDKSEVTKNDSKTEEDVTKKFKDFVEEFVSSHQPPKANGDYRPFIPPSYYENRMNEFKEAVNKFLEENNAPDSLKKAINELFDNARKEGNMDITSLGEAIAAKFSEYNSAKNSKIEVSEKGITLNKIDESSIKPRLSNLNKINRNQQDI